MVIKDIIESLRFWLIKIRSPFSLILTIVSILCAILYILFENIELLNSISKYPFIVLILCFAINGLFKGIYSLFIGEYIIKRNFIISGLAARMVGIISISIGIALLMITQFLW